MSEAVGNDAAKTKRSIDPRVDIGHVHLKVADIDRSLGFYRDILGFDEMQRHGDQAAFISAGGYHHHLGLNTWAAGAAPAGDDDARLLEWEVAVPANGETTLTVEFQTRF